MLHRSKLISIAASIAVLVAGAAAATVMSADQASAKTAKTKTVAKSAPVSRSGRDAPAPQRSTYQSY
jgi:hypothetical protein